ncbi:MAG: adenylate kinase [Candidatus Rokubacteria bacterium]|nr:adenylate kinase [Candidatus Rokubacteria bacterium]
MRIAFLGPPGAGKGTQARELAREWGVPQIATGDILRSAAAAGTPLGREAARIMATGALVPDDVIMGLIGDRLRQPDAARGSIFDGFPRTIGQAEALEKLLKERGEALDVVLFFAVSEAELLRRLTGRRVCRTCGETFHVASQPPQRAGVCDTCGGELHQREDDSEATVRRRLEVYSRQTEPLLALYESRGLLRRVHGEGAIDGIRAELKRATEAVAGRGGAAR